VISRRLETPTRWTVALAALGAVVAIYRLWLHVNPTTVALTFLLLALTVAARWGLKLAVVVSIAATVCYNLLFLPPLGTLTIADPQNWIALLTFLSTSVIASRLSTRVREEALEAKRKEQEVEALFHLSRELLQTDNVAELLRTVPDSIARVTGASSVALYLESGHQMFRSSQPSEDDFSREQPEQLMLLPRVTAMTSGAGVAVPLRAGVRPRGTLFMARTALSEETLEALGGLVSIAIDRAQALEKAARSEAAKENERLRSLMLDSITHELRTPLTAIKASATTLLSSAPLSSDDHQELLTVIDEETDRLNRLIAQAVEMAQLDTQEVQMDLRPTSVEEVVRQGVHACAVQFAARPVTVTLQPNLPKVLAEATWLQKVVCNLLENAAKYSPPGSPITVTATAEGDQVRVGVTDSGVGIDPTEQSLIFEKFYRGRTQANRLPGTGMGLAISRAIVEAHHGSIGVASEPGKGSAFTISLPIWRSAARSS
jgi:two-component system sensor histidine kinase KdpD